MIFADYVQAPILMIFRQKPTHKQAKNGIKIINKRVTEHESDEKAGQTQTHEINNLDQQKIQKHSRFARLEEGIQMRILR
jgi:predicted DNA binding CopG/RHH family protein